MKDPENPAKDDMIEMEIKVSTNWDSEKCSVPVSGG